MGNSHCGAGLVDMLPPGAARPVCINTQILLVYIYIDIVIQFRKNKYGCK